MLKKYSNVIFAILLIIMVITAMIFSGYKYIPEVYTGTIYSVALYLILKGILQKTNDKRIVIKTKKFNWIFMIGWVALGILKMIYKIPVDSKLLFGFFSEPASQGIGFMLLGIALFQRNIIIDDSGIRINDVFTSLIKFSDLTAFNLTNMTLLISNKDFSYNFKIFMLTDDRIDLVNKKIAEKCTLPDMRQNL